MRRIITLLFAGLSIAGLTYLLTQSSFMSEQLAPFLFRLTLIIRDLLLSLPDIVYWSLFCALMLFMGAATAFRLFLIWLEEGDAPLNVDTSTPIGPVRRYADWIDNTKDGQFYRHQLARELAVFSFQLLQRPETALPEIDAAIADGTVSFTSDVATYMRQGTTRKNVSQSERLLNGGGLTASASMEGLVATIEMLEAEMGIELPVEEVGVVRWALLLSLALALLIMGLMARSASLLLLTLPLLIVFAIGVWQSAEKLTLAATRELSATTLRVGEPLEVKLTITNNGGNLTELHLDDFSSSRLTVSDGHLRRTVRLAAGAQFELTYTLTGRRGLYRVPYVRATAYDTFGLFKQRSRIDVTGDTAFQITPRYEQIDGIVIRPKQTRSFAGYIPARIPGSGIDFFGVRDYRPGDSLRHINWRAVSRNPDSIFTNEFEQERVADIGLILDAREQAITFAQDTEILEYKISAATAFSESLLSLGNRVSLLVYGSYLNWTLPGYGKHQHQRIVRNLTTASTGSSEVFSTLNHLPTRLFPAQSQLIVFSTLLPEDLNALRRMRARGYSVMVISPDPVAFEQSILWPSESVRLAARIANLKRHHLIQQMRQAGIQIANWDVEQPLKELVKAQLQRPPLLRPTAI